MDAILRGTTPSVILAIDPDDFLLSAVTKVEMYIQSTYTKTYTGTALTIDTTENTVTKQFTEDETAAFCAGQEVTAQARFWFSDGSIVGTLPIIFSVADMLGV